MSSPRRAEHTAKLQIIQARSPAWLATASAADLQRLEALSAQAEQARRALQAATASLPQYERYARGRLRAILAQMGEHAAEPTTAVLHWTDPDGAQPPMTCTLVQAALRNFTEEDTDAQAFGPGSGIFRATDTKGQPVGRTRLAIAPEAFAAACRQADIGQGFAQTLRAELPAQVTGAAMGSFPGLFMQADRTNLAGEVCVARLKGRLDSVGEQLLANWIALEGITPMPATAQRLAVAGFSISRALVITAKQGETSGQPCVLYVPNDPYAPLAQFQNMAALQTELAHRVNHPAYVRFLAGYVGLEHEAAFIRAIEGPPSTDFDRLFDIAINPLKALELAERVLEHEPPFPRPELWLEVAPLDHLFSDRYAAWARQTLADASAIAVSTARVDRQAVLARHQRWVNAAEQLGVLVLSVIPGLGEIVAVYSMVQTLRSLYELSMAWAAGDEQRARAVLIGAAENARYMLPAQGRPSDAEQEAFLARLRLIASADGQMRLWLPHLPFRGHSATLPIEPVPREGLLRQGSEAWVSMDGRLVPVHADATAYIAQPMAPANQRGYVPRLLGNGDGGWRADYESPSHWTSSQLLRRSWGEGSELRDEARVLAHRLAGIDDTVLQGMAVRGERLPSLLRYLLYRRRGARVLEQNLQALRSQAVLRNPHPALLERLVLVPGWPMEVGIELQEGAGPVTRLHPDRTRWSRLQVADLVKGGWVTSLVAQMSSEELAGLSIDADVNAMARRLAKQWADALEGQAGAVLDSLGEATTSPTAFSGPGRVLVRQFPGLPRLMVDDLVQRCTTVQRRRLDQGRVPVAVAEQAAEQCRQVRIARALEAIHERYGTEDRDRLLVGLLPNLPSWPNNLSLEVREHQAQGPLIQRIGAVTDSPWLVIRQHGRFQAMRGQYRSASLDSLEEALIQIAGATTSGQQPWADGLALRSEVFEYGLAHRGRVRELLGLGTDTRPFFRAPTRLVDGRRGYALSGRGRGTPVAPNDFILHLLRELYPDADAATLQRLRLEIGTGPTASAELARRRQDLSRLRSELDAWRVQPIGNDPGAVVVPAREIVVWLMLQAWQYRFVSSRALPSDLGVCYTLNLSYLNIGGGLPSLSVSFPHILELSLSDMGLQEVDPQFLACFPNARVLRLDENPLRVLPTGPAWLGQLRELYLRDIGSHTAGHILEWLQPCAGTLTALDLSSNPGVPADALLARLGQFNQLRLLELTGINLRLTLQTRGAFRALPHLEMLSLNRNPLQMPPNLEGMYQLHWLSLQESGLEGLPPGLETLMRRNDLRLNYVNLASNEISSLPDLSASEFFIRAALRMDGPEAFEFIMDDNPLGPEAAGMLRRAGFHVFPRQESEDSAPAPDQWLEGCPPTLAEHIRAAREEPAAQPFYDVLAQVVRTAPYLRARDDSQRQEARGRAWRLAERFLATPDALPGLDQLRERLYQMATDAQATCGDGVVLTLDQFESEVRVWAAIAGASDPTEDGPLLVALQPARQLFRQALLDGQAERLIRAREARLDGREADDSAVVLEDDIAEHLLEMSTDEVELRLLLRQRLHAVLDLPAVSERLYDAIVGDETLLRITARVQALDTPEAFAQWLINHQATWREALEHRYADAFEQVREPYNDAVAYLLARAAGEDSEPLSPGALSALEAAEPNVAWRNPQGEPEQPPVTEQQALILSNRLGEACNAAVGALRLEMAQQLIERANPPR